jgi:uncharacterized protein (DUF2237 family)
VKRLEGGIAELLGDAQMPLTVLLRASIEGQLQAGTQQVGVHAICARLYKLLLRLHGIV